MFFPKVLHGIKSGNDGDLDTARSLCMNISCVRARPLTFFVHQGKAPPNILENVAGSHDCYTGDTVWSCYVVDRASFYFAMKNLSKWPWLGLEESIGNVEW